MPEKDFLVVLPNGKSKSYSAEEYNTPEMNDWLSSNTDIQSYERSAYDKTQENLDGDSFAVTMPNGKSKVYSREEFEDPTMTDWLQQNPTYTVTRMRPAGAWGDKVRKEYSHANALDNLAGRDEYPHGEEWDEIERMREERAALRRELEGIVDAEPSDPRVIQGKSVNEAQRNAQLSQKRKGELQRQIAELSEKIDNSNLVLGERNKMLGATRRFDKALDEAYAPIAERKREEGRKASTFGGTSIAAGGAPVFYGQDYDDRIYSAAKRLNEDTIRLYEAPSKYGPENGLANFWKGAKDRLSTADFWTMGLAGIQDQMELKGVFDKIRDKIGGMKDVTEENIDEALTPMEKQLLSAFFRNADAQASRAEDLSSAYVAGQSAADSIEFMAEFALSGKVTGALGKALSKSGPVKAMSNWISKNLGKAGSTAVGAATKRVVSDAGKATASMFFQPGTLKSVVEAKNQLDESGEIVDQTKAFWNGLLDRGIEVFSERTGDYLGNFLGWAGKSVPGGKKLAESFARTPFGQWGRAFYNSSTLGFLKAGGWHNGIGEILEEYIGDGLRTITGVDPDAWNRATTSENLGILAMSFLPMTIIGGGVNTVKYGATKNQYNSSRSALESRMEALGFTPEQIEHAVDLGRMDSPENLGKSIGTLMTELDQRGATEQDKMIAADYALNAAKMNIYDSFEQEKVKERRNAMLTDLTAEFGDFWQNNNDGERMVERVALPDGQTGYVLNTDETGLMSVKFDDGHIGFTDVEHGAQTEMQTLDQYLDSAILTEDKARNAADYEEELAEAVSQFQQYIKQNAPVQMGTSENPIEGVLVRDENGVPMRDGDAYQISTADGIVSIGADELARKWGISLTPETQEQKDADDVARYEAAKQRRDVYNLIPRGTEVYASLEGIENPVPYKFTRAVFDEDAQEVMVFAEDLESGEEVEFPETAFPELEDIGAQFEADIDAEVAAQNEAAPVEEAVAEGTPVEDLPEPEIPRDFRGNPLPLKENGAVDQTELWNKDPEAWAAWNDQQRQDGGANTTAYVQAAVNKVQGEITKIQKAYAKELDFDKREQMEAQIAQRSERLSSLNGILDTYKQREAEAELAAAAEQQAAAEQATAKQNEVEPRTPVELASAFFRNLMSTGRLKGALKKSDFKRELGWGETELKRFFPWWGKKGKGKTLNELAEDMAKDFDTYGIIPMVGDADQKDTEVARNAIIDLMNASETPSDVYGYLNRKREEEDENYDAYSDAAYADALALQERQAEIEEAWMEYSAGSADLASEEQENSINFTSNYYNEYGEDTRSLEETLEPAEIGAEAVPGSGADNAGGVLESEGQPSAVESVDADESGVVPGEEPGAGAVGAVAGGAEGVAGASEGVQEQAQEGVEQGVIDFEAPVEGAAPEAAEEAAQEQETPAEEPATFQQQIEALAVRHQELDDEYDKLFSEWIKEKDEKKAGENTQKRLDLRMKDMREVKNQIRDLVSKATPEQLESLAGITNKEAREIIDDAIKRNDERKEHSRISALVAEMQDVPDVKAKPLGKFKASDYLAPKSDARLGLTGTFHDNGYAVSSDSHIMVADKESYDKKNNGKIINRDGKPVQAKYAKWREVFNNQFSSQKFDFGKLRDFLAGATQMVEAEFEKSKESGMSGRSTKKDYLDYAKVILNLDTDVAVAMKLGSLAKFADFAERIGAKDIYFMDERRAILVKTGKGMAALMPIQLNYREGYETSEADRAKWMVENSTYSYGENDYQKSLAEQPAEQAQAKQKPAELTAEEVEQKRQQPLIDRVKEWEDRTGQSIEVVTKREDVTDPVAKAYLAVGQKPKGWFNPALQKVVVYLPANEDVSDIDKTYMHEIVSHKGLRELLGENGFNELMDSVWKDLMTEDDHREWLAYNAHLTGSQEYLQRAAADEYVAHLAESVEANPTAWEKFVEMVREILRKIGLDVKLTDADLKALLQASLANYEHQQAEAKAQAREQEQAEAAAKQEAHEDTKNYISGARIKSADTDSAAANPQVPISEAKEKYEDFGEKIGWARKDLAKKGIKKGEGDSRPAWLKKYSTSNVEALEAEAAAQARMLGLNSQFQEVTYDAAKGTDFNRPFVGYYIEKKKHYGREHSYKRFITDENRKPIIFKSLEQYEATVPVFEAREQGYRVAKKGEKYVIYRPASNGKAVEYAEFPTKEEAVAYLATPEGCTELLNRKRENFELPALEELTRIGMPDYRNGRNITPDDFQKEFGFRGGEFGNWLNADERQQFLNYAYDALMDLANVLGISPSALSLNGELSIAFGARGHQGAKAHYEPTKAVINLTKMNGAGSLAHEWAHALDNYFGLMDAKATRNREKEVEENRQYLSEGTSWKKGARDEVRKAFAEVMDAIKTKVVTREIEQGQADEEVEQMRKWAYGELENYRKRLENGRTTRKYNRKTKNYDEVKYTLTPEQLAEFDQLIKDLDNDKTFKWEYDFAKKGFRAHGEVGEKIYKLIEDVMPNRADAYGPLNDFFYYYNRLLPKLQRQQEAREGKSETVKTETDVYKDSKWFDRGRAGAYFSKEVELFARALETYVSGEVQAEQHTSDYLTYEKGPLYKEIWGHNPYPAGEERKAVKKAFDNLFNTIQEKSENGRQVLFSKKQKAPETVSVSPNGEHQPTVVSDAYAANVVKNLESLASEYENLTNRTNTFIGDVAKAINAKQFGSKSQYATFETKNGRVVTIRLADHNAHSSGFDHNGKSDGISIVISPKPNQKMTNDGKAHIVEYFYDALKLRRAEGKPLVEIVKSLQQALYSGEYKDTTGLAEVEEVNANNAAETLFRKGQFEQEKKELDEVDPQMLRVFHGSGADFERFDHSHMNEGEGNQAYGWGTYVASNKDVANDYAVRFGEPGNRHLYTVEIPADNGKNYIHWDKPLTNQQSEKIMDAVRKLADKDAWGDEFEYELKSSLGPGTYGRYVEGALDYFLGNEMNYETEENPGAERNAKLLSSLGFVGIEIPMERGGVLPGSDYVIFNEDDLKIVNNLRFRKVEDPKKIEELEAGEKEIGYRNVVMNPDGTLGSPMAGRLGKRGEKSVATSGFAFNEWEQAEENPDMATDKGKINLIKPNGKGSVDGVDYNPYIHIRPNTLNKQFTQAWRRPELVYVETQYPASELKGEYKADKAKLSVGRHEWNGGELILSRYDKPVRVVPWVEVSEDWAKEFGESGVTFDIVPPGLLPILSARGVEILPPKKAAGKPAMDAYNDWKNQNILFRKSNENQDIFISNAESALSKIKMEKATPEQWVKMLEKEGGLKAGEDKWLGLSEWLNGLDRKTVTKQEIADYIGENKIQIEEQHYSDSVDVDKALHDEIKNTIGRGKELEEIQAEIDELVGSDEYKSLYDDEEKDNWLLDQMKDRYGDDFELGYYIDEEQKVDYGVSPWDYDEEEINKRLETKLINSVRKGYTTNGLENLHEIALTVPTIEPWNESDQIHFGDAGEGRAIAWIRFGDAMGSVAEDIDRVSEYEHYKKEYGKEWAAAKTKLDRGVIGRMKEQAELDLIAAEQKLEKLDKDFSDVAGKSGRVLVIDEIQSKRHQEGRESGYKNDAPMKAAMKRHKDALKAFDDYSQSLYDKYGYAEYAQKATEDELKEYRRLKSEVDEALRIVGDGGFDPMQDEEYRDLRKKWEDVGKELISERAKNQPRILELNQQIYSGKLDKEELARLSQEKANLKGDYYDLEQKEKFWENAMSARRESLRYDFNKQSGTVPAAPFEKNWHELALKRMLRYASENDYDVVAWTTGDQQAERYNIGGVLNSIERRESNNLHEKDFTLNLNGYGTQYITTDEEGNVINTIVDDFKGKNLSEIVGKELAVKMLSMGENEVIEGEGLRVGGEGMRGFYDDILPRFMNKYGKKWGASVKDIALKDIYDETGKPMVMHSVDVTPEMKASVMEGQLMFRLDDRKDGESAYDFTSRVNTELSRKYHSLASSVVVKGKESGSDGDFDREKKIITIFAKENNPMASEIENTFFHENFHAAVDKMDDKAAFIGKFIGAAEQRFSEEDLAELKRVVEERYDESEWDEEKAANMFSALLVDGNAKIDGIPAYDEILNALRYEPEREARERSEEDEAAVPADELRDSEEEGNEGEEMTTRSAAASLVEQYDEQDGSSKYPWMSERELMDRFQEEIPYEADTEDLYALIDKYNRLDEADFDEGRRDYSGSEKDDTFEEFLSALRELAKDGDIRFRKEANEFSRAINNWLGGMVDEGSDFNIWLGGEKYIATITDGNLVISDGEKNVYSLQLEDWENGEREKLERWMAKESGKNSNDYLPNLSAETSAEVGELLKREDVGIAPNGNRSNLSNNLWALVRTKSFKEYFGDWEADPENASKVLDENGEPQVVYHGTTKSFDTFERQEINFGHTFGDGFYFTDSIGEAAFYANNNRTGESNIISAFLNIRRPFDVKRTDNLRDAKIPDGYDGVIARHIQDSSDEYVDIFVAKDSNQIKSAWGNSGEFSKDSDNIRMRYTVEHGPTAEELVKKVQAFGLRGILNKEQVSDFWAFVMRSMPEETRKEIVDKAFGKDLNVRRQEQDYIAELASKGYANDESGLLRLAADHLSTLISTDQPLTENDLLYMIWRGSRRYASNDILGMASDIAIRRRLGIGEYGSEKFPGKAEEIRDEAADNVLKADEERNAAREEAGRKARKSPFAAINAAMTAQRNYDRETIDNIVALAKQMIKEGNISSMNAREMGRLLTIIKSANGRRTETVYKCCQQLMDFMVDHTLDTESDLLEKMMKIRTAKVKDPGIDVQAKLDLRAQGIVNAFRGNMASSEEQIRASLADIQDKLDSGNLSETRKDELQAEADGLNLALQYATEIAGNEGQVEAVRESINEARAEYNDLPESEQKRHAKMLKEEVDAAYARIRQLKIDRVNAYREMRAALAETLSEGAERAKSWLESERERIGQIHHEANSDMQGIDDDPIEPRSGFAQWLVDNQVARLLTSPLATFDQMLRLLGRKHPNGQGYLWSRYMKQIRTANDNEKVGLDAANDTLNKKVQEIFDDPTMTWNDLYNLEKGEPTATIRFFNANGKWVEQELTPGNQLYIYMVDKMPDGQMKLRQMGITEADARSIKDNLDPKFIELADWVQSEFLSNLRDKYNQVHQRLFGTSMAAIENYFPLRILGGVIQENIDLSNPDSNELPSAMTGAIIKRTVNRKQLDITGADAFSVVIEHVQEMEHWAAYAELNRDLGTLLSYKRFQNQMKHLTTVYGSGKKLWGNFKKTAVLAASEYRPARTPLDEAAINIARGVSTAKIAFRAYTALKQVLSWPAFLADANTVELAKATNPAKWSENWKWAMENLPNFKKRVEKRTTGNEKLEDDDLDAAIWKGDFAKWISKYGMSMNAFVDALTVSIGAKSIYETKRKQYMAEGFDEAQADKKAKFDAVTLFNETQQSSEKEFMSTMQADRTVTSVALSVYRNSSFGYQRQVHHGLRTLGRMAQKGYKEESIAFMTKQLVREGLTEEQAAKAAEERYNRAGYQAAVRVAVFGWLVEFAWNLGAHAVYLLFGNDPDEKKAMLEEDAKKALSGGMVEGLAGGSVISDVFAKIENGESLYGYDMNTLPIMQDIKNTIGRFKTDPIAATNDLVYLAAQIGIGANPQTMSDAIVAIIDACRGNLETSKEAMLLILRILQVPQSQLDELMIDEIGMSAKDARALSYEEIAQRYADYKVMRNAGALTPLYSDELKEKREKSAKTTFKKKYNKRKDLKDQE